MWIYCNTNENLADTIIRFRHHDLTSNSLWYEGTFFLYHINEKTLSTKENLEIETGNQSQITEFSGEIVNKSTTLVSISNEVFRIGNIVNIEYFCDLIELFRLSA